MKLLVDTIPESADSCTFNTYYSGGFDCKLTSDICELDRCGKCHLLMSIDKCRNTKPNKDTTRNKIIDEFATKLKHYYKAYDVDLCLQDNDHFSYTHSCEAFESYIDEIANNLKDK